VLAHVLNPEISPRWRMLSELSLGRFGWVMDLAFIAWMVAHLVLAKALFPFVPVSQAILLGAVGVLQGAAGYFRTDPIEVPAERPTRARRWHYFAAIGYIVGFPLVILMLSISLTAGGYPMARRASILAVPVWLSFVAFIFLLVRWRRQGRDITRDVPLGLPNRLLVVTYLGWLFGMAMKV
jgi:Protein of unknown function (DUF998)